MFYVLDDNNNKYEGADIQEILAILNQAIEQGTLENITKDSAFVTKVKCCVGGATHHIAFITAAKYNELAAGNQLIADCYYIITDDTTCDDIDKALEELDTTTKNHAKTLQNLQRTVEEGFRSMETGLLSGSIIPLKASKLDTKTLTVTTAISKAGLYAVQWNFVTGSTLNKDYIFTLIISIDDITKKYAAANNVRLDGDNKEIVIYYNLNNDKKFTIGVSTTLANIVGVRLITAY